MTTQRTYLYFLTIAIVHICIGSAITSITTAADEVKDTKAVDGAAIDSSKLKTADWIPLLEKANFDASWSKTSFGGEGAVEWTEDGLQFGYGQPLTGITYSKQDFPKDNYEVHWSAKRISGGDFLAGITMPIGEEFFSFVAGGWGGSLVGISSINGHDASDNDTTRFEQFENGKWYDFRVRVEPTKLVVWIGDKEIITVDRKDKKFGLRMEVRASKPFGYCVFQSKVALKDLEYRMLDAVGTSDESPKVAMTSSDAAKIRKPSFFQLTTDKKGNPKALQTAIAHYEVPGKDAQTVKVDLIGAVHVGEQTYYQALNKQFKTYDALLFELVADPEVRLGEAREDRGVYNPVSAIQVGMKDALGLTFQLDEVDYAAKNFVHADMTPEEFMEDMKKRNDGFMSMFARVIGSSMAAQTLNTATGADAKMIAALTATTDRQQSLRRAMASQFLTADIQLMGLADKNGKSTLLTERNGKAMKILKREIEGEKKRMGIFYGAAHLDDMHMRLLNDFGAKYLGIDWLDAWSLE